MPLLLLLVIRLDLEEPSNRESSPIILIDQGMMGRAQQQEVFITVDLRVFGVIPCAPRTLRPNMRLLAEDRAAIAYIRCFNKLLQTCGVGALVVRSCPQNLAIPNCGPHPTPQIEGSPRIFKETIARSSRQPLRATSSLAFEASTASCWTLFTIGLNARDEKRSPTRQAFFVKVPPLLSKFPINYDVAPLTCSSPHTSEGLVLPYSDSRCSNFPPAGCGSTLQR